MDLWDRTRHELKMMEVKMDESHNEVVISEYLMYLVLAITTTTYIHTNKQHAGHHHICIHVSQSFHVVVKQTSNISKPTDQ